MRKRLDYLNAMARLLENKPNGCCINKPGQDIYQACNEVLNE
jgi:hypothetical protein